MRQAKSNYAIVSLIGTALLLIGCAGDGGGGAPVPPPVGSSPANVVIARGLGDNCASNSLGGDIYLAKEDGSAALVTLANSPDFEVFKASTPGGRVIYQRIIGPCSQSDLYSVNADGTGTVLLAASANFSGITG